MSRYRQRPFDLKPIPTQPLAHRPSKVGLEALGSPHVKGAGTTGFLASIPDILAGRSIRDLARSILLARKQEKPVLVGFGGHVIKCGLGPVLADLVRRRIVTGLATNGSGAIHDAELALAGKTSEDVSQRLHAGTYGTSRETGELFADAAKVAIDRHIGLGEALCDCLAEANPAHPNVSLLLAARDMDVPVTVHVAFGTDTVHLFPKLDPAALGTATHHDLRLFTSQVASLSNGGVYLNLGSAVILPEVFLKALSAIRNTGGSLEGIVTANLDFLQHYRPRENVLKRPTMSGGKSFAITGHHELTIPLLALLLIESELLG